MLEGTRPEFHRWLPNIFVAQLRTHSSRVSQPPESEILPLLVYKDVPSQPSTVPSAPTHQPSQTQSEVEVSHLRVFV